jgi:K+-sensing histidine kinase KdpD
METPGRIIAETIATLLGIFVGTLAALATDRYNERRKKQRRARVILRSLSQELNENYDTLRSVKLRITEHLGERASTSAPSPGRRLYPAGICPTS